MDLNTRPPVSTLPPTQSHLIMINLRKSPSVLNNGCLSPFLQFKYIHITPWIINTFISQLSLKHRMERRKDLAHHCPSSPASARPAGRITIFQQNLVGHIIFHSWHPRSGSYSWHAPRSTNKSQLLFSLFWFVKKSDFLTCLKEAVLRKTTALVCSNAQNNVWF